MAPLLCRASNASRFKFGLEYTGADEVLVIVEVLVNLTLLSQDFPWFETVDRFFNGDSSWSEELAESELMVELTEAPRLREFPACGGNFLINFSGRKQKLWPSISSRPVFVCERRQTFVRPNGQIWTNVNVNVYVNVNVWTNVNVINAARGPQKRTKTMSNMILIPKNERRRTLANIGQIYSKIPKNTPKIPQNAPKTSKTNVKNVKNEEKFPNLDDR